jgi:ribosomal protein L13
MYYRHSMYPGGLKVESLGKLLARRPTRVIERAVKGMLPHNRLGRAIYGHLKVYAGPDHPHESQVKASEKRRQAPAGDGPEEQTTKQAAEQASPVPPESAQASEA